MTPFMQILASNIREALRKGRVPRMPRMASRAWFYPIALEQNYASWLKSLFDSKNTALIAIVREYLPQLLPMHLLDGTTNDEFEQEWAITTAELLEKQRQLGVATATSATAAVFYFGEKIAEFNGKQWDKFSQIALGQLFRGDEPWAKAILEEWKETQLSLITKFDKDVIAKIGTIVETGIQNGIHLNSIIDDLILKIPRMSAQRAIIIARDQTTKLNSSFTRSRQLDAGLTRYEWATSRDERVRGRPGGKWQKVQPDHWIMHGKICLFSDSTVMEVDGVVVPRPSGAVMLHPGMDIACRCTYFPYIKDAWDALVRLETETKEQK